MTTTHTQTPVVKLASLNAIHGGLSKPSKMPGLAYGIPAKHCKVGSKLVNVPNSVCSKCYALKGRYSFKNVQDAQQRRFDTLNDPLWVDAITESIRRSKTDYFRWHDSGDLQSVDHLERICQVAWKLPNVKFWLPTRERAIVRDHHEEFGKPPKNLIIRVSATMIDGKAPTGFRNTSTVTTGEPSCPAYTQGGICGDCRKCWDGRVRNVSYPKH